MVFDASAAAAARRETQGEPFQFSWDGDKYQMDSPKEWPVEATDALAEGLLGDAFDLLVRPRRPKGLAVADVEAIMTECARHFGLGDDAGE